MQQRRPCANDLEEDLLDSSRLVLGSLVNFRLRPRRRPRPIRSRLSFILKTRIILKPAVLEAQVPMACCVPSPNLSRLSYGRGCWDERPCHDISSGALHGLGKSLAGKGEHLVHSRGGVVKFFLPLLVEEACFDRLE